MLRVLLGDLRAFDVVNKGRGPRRLVVTKDVWMTWFSPRVNVVGRKRVAMLEGLEEVVVIKGNGIWGMRMKEREMEGYWWFPREMRRSHAVRRMFWRGGELLRMRGWGME
jgi:hypothetical protein